MTRMEVHNCLRTLQPVPGESPLSEEELTELLKKKLIKRKVGTNSVWLTELGMHTKTGAV